MCWSDWLCFYLFGGKMNREMYWCKYGSGRNCNNPNKSGYLCCNPHRVKTCNAYKRMTNQCHEHMMSNCRIAGAGGRGRYIIPEGSYIV